MNSIRLDNCEIDTVRSMKDTADTDCRQCKAPAPKPTDGFALLGYACEKCGHYNNLKRRKPQRP